MRPGLDAAPGIVAIVLVTAATLLIGTWGLRISRTTSDFFVASRTVNPRLNASAIGGEYLSGASFLGVAGLVLINGADMLWYPVGWTAGYLVLLVLVAAPLRRSGAYTLPDFAEARLGSRSVRATCSLLVVAIGWLYLVPQFQGAGLALQYAVGAPTWVGPVIVSLVVLANLTSGGMRSITFVQAFQYWLKLTALLVPAFVLVAIWLGDGAPRVPVGEEWSAPLGSGGPRDLYLTYSLIIGTFLGTMGLPHVVVRFYTNPDGRAARRTTLAVLVLLGVFYLLPPVYAALGRIYAPDLAVAPHSEALVLELPQIMAAGAVGEVLSAVVTAGAFAAFLSTSSGLSFAVAGVIGQDVVGRTRWSGVRLGGVTAFRLAAVLAIAVPFVVALLVPSIGVARAVGLAFAMAAATFCPLLLLGIWWRHLTDTGALAGLAVGGLGSAFAVAWTVAAGPSDGWVDALMAQPAAWTVPLALGTMASVSKLTAARVPEAAGRFLVRLHTPETVELDRG